jgi:mono/diheme cytochrome c family protein
MTTLAFPAILVAALASLVNSASAQDLAVTRGRAIANANCSPCHAIGPLGKSPFELAPPFRDLHKRYPVEDLEEPLVEGIMTGHPSMPEFQLAPDEAADLIAYMKTLE